MEIEKAYFTLQEVLDRWSMPEADLVYLAENDQLRLSIRILNLPIEFGDFEETDDGRCHSIPCERSWFNGLLDLHVQDVFQLFRIGEVSVTCFRTTKADYACFWGSRETLTIRKPDLVLSREERDSFEAKSGFLGASALKPANAFYASADYHHVRCNGHEFQLGPIQAQVVRILHAAARRGDAVAKRQGCVGGGGVAQPQDVRHLQVEEGLATADRIERSRGLSPRRTLSPSSFATPEGAAVGCAGGWVWDGDPPQRDSPNDCSHRPIPRRIPL